MSAGVRRMHVTVTNDDGDVLYRTWQAEDSRWETVTLMLHETSTDCDGEPIGLSYWDLTRRTAAQIAEDGIVDQQEGGG